MSILRILGMLVIGTGLALQMTATAHAERRVALVVGNDAYRSLPHLANPANDANLVAAALKQDDFDVTIANNLDHDGLIKALQDFGSKAHDADWAVVYYTGHGIEIAEKDYLIPVDAKLGSDSDVAREAVPLDQVLTAVGGARSLRVVILDASRDNPFPATTKTSPAAGLALVALAKGTLVAYATSPGGLIADGGGVNGPYAIALAKHLVEPGLDVGKLFRLVRDEVIAATGTKQLPFVYASLPGEALYFRH